MPLQIITTICNLSLKILFEISAICGSIQSAYWAKGCNHKKVLIELSKPKALNIYLIKFSEHIHLQGPATSGCFLL